MLHMYDKVIELVPIYGKITKIVLCKNYLIVLMFEKVIENCHYEIIFYLMVSMFDTVIIGPANYLIIFMLRKL